MALGCICLAVALFRSRYAKTAALSPPLGEPWHGHFCQALSLSLSLPFASQHQTVAKQANSYCPNDAKSCTDRDHSLRPGGVSRGHGSNNTEMKFVQIWLSNRTICSLFASDSVWNSFFPPFPALRLNAFIARAREKNKRQ